MHDEVNIDLKLSLLTTVASEESEGFRLEGRRFGQLHDWARRRSLAELARVLALSCKFIQQGTEALQLVAILGPTLDLSGLNVHCWLC